MSKRSRLQWKDILRYLMKAAACSRAMPKSEEIHLTRLDKRWSRRSGGHRSQSSETPPTTTSPLSSADDEFSAAWFSTVANQENCDEAPWNPAKRIVTFMCVVCAVCTCIVVGIVLMAVVVSRTLGNPSMNTIPPLDVLEVVPYPRTYPDHEGKTILIHEPTRNSSGWRQHVLELERMISAYSRVQKSSRAPECDLRDDAPPRTRSNLTCLIPVEQIDQNCSIARNFGYDVLSPCFALIFHVIRDWIPIPYDASEVPRPIRGEYDPKLLFLTCRNDRVPLQFRYSPYQGYPLQAFPSQWWKTSPSVTPLIMVQVLNPPLRTDLSITCLLWSKNIDHKNRDDKKRSMVSGKVSFNLYIM